MIGNTIILLTIEKRSGEYTQQPVIMEYVTNRLIRQFKQPIQIWDMQTGETVQTLKRYFSLRRHEY